MSLVLLIGLWPCMAWAFCPILRCISVAPRGLFRGGSRFVSRFLSAVPWARCQWRPWYGPTPHPCASCMRVCRGAGVGAVGGCSVGARLVRWRSWSL